MSQNADGKRVVVTGMGINTPLGDDLDTYYQNLIAGRSAISSWNTLDCSKIYSKIGGDLTGYDVAGKLTALSRRMSEQTYRRLCRIAKKATFVAQLTVLCAVDAFLDAQLDQSPDLFEAAIISGGHNFQLNYDYQTTLQFLQEPEFIEPMYSVYHMDTNLSASIGEVLAAKGPIYTVGGACASSNMAIRSAIDEIKFHGCNLVFVVGPVFDYSPVSLQALALLGAISSQSFNDQPQRASRPFDMLREGFVPSHGVGTLILEDYEHARARGAKMYAEVLGVTSYSDASHLPVPSKEGQMRTMAKLLEITGVRPEQIDYINLHATSTTLGDLTEAMAIKAVFGKHTYELKTNATKSMLGHCCWSAAAIETIAAILQMQHGCLHPSINIEEMDPQVDFDVCAMRPITHEVNYFMKNAFGFGGINSASLFRRVDAV